MFLLSPRIKRRVLPLLAASGSLAVLTTRATACGPFFPNQVIANSDGGILSMPIGDFAAEMDALCPAHAMHTASPSHDPDSERTRPSAFQLSADADESELRQALGPGDQTKKILDEYSLVRSQITGHSQAVADNREKALPNNNENPKADPIQAPLPDGLPPEFSDYMRGLIAYHNGDVQSARADWQALLARPANQRKFRSTWAAFMLGKSYIADDPTEAKKWFAKTREFAAAGSADSADLASSSFGWEGKTELDSGHIPAAIALYLQQHAAGEPTAAMSLRDCAVKAFAAGPAALAETARDNLSRRVITAYILSDAGPFMSLSPTEQQLIPAWLAAVESANVVGMPGADRLAWAAYRSASFDDAARWVARASRGAPIAEWVRAKLLLRDGKIDDAAAQLATLVKSFPSDDHWLSGEGYNDELDRPTISDVGPSPTMIPPVVGDLAVLRLTRGQYVDSLDLLLRADYWMDAAYVAERILTVDELKTYVDRRFPAPAKTTGDKVEVFVVNSQKNRAAETTAIRHLLAHRLARAGRYGEARAYYPADLQSTFDDSVAGIRRGKDLTRPDPDRAAGYLAAARITRTSGMELLGTELDPDYFCYGGSFETGDSESDINRAKHQPILAPSRDELARYRANAPADARRFHYRYTAADYAWSAAELMPDNTDDTASVLYEAGCWIKDRDPKSANRFYKSLVQRCPGTALAKAAAKIHWFPTTKPSA